MASISFVTKRSNSIYKIELSKTLLQFIEFDFSYFWEQAIAIGKQAKKNNSFPYEQSDFLKNLIKKCHPYFESMINFDFDDVAIDCIIEYICRNENIGLEALWARCISPKNSYEKVIFKRISEYKTNRAINQWINLLRIQEYAKTKVAFIFNGEISSIPEYTARCKYFDLAYSVVAKETGYSSDELPAVQEYSVARMPNSVFIISKTAKDIYKRLSENLEDAPEPRKLRLNDTLRDSYALDAFDYIRNLTRPADTEMFAAIESFRNLPDTVYLPNSFKALIDLEIDKMLENGINYIKCLECGRYFRKEEGYNGKLCNRVKSTGKSCREEAEEAKGEKDNISDDINKKSDLLYASLLRKAGVEISKEEFGDWSEYLTRLKNNVKSKNSTVEDLEAFLDYTEKMYGEIMTSEE